MKDRSLALLPIASALVTLLFLTGCRPDLPQPTPTRSRTGSTPEEGFSLTTDPPAPLDAAPRVLRLRLSAPADLDDARVRLVRGTVSKSQLGQIARDEIGKTLAARIVPAVMFRADADEGRAALILAPSMPLEPGETYAVASGSPRTSLRFEVASEDDAPYLARMWPSAGESGTATIGVFCGHAALPAITLPITLDPDSAPAMILSGAVASGAGRGCVHLTMEALPPPQNEVPRIPPPMIALSDLASPLRLDPRPFTVDAPDVPLPEPLACEANEVPFGPGCAEVEDDRILGRTPAAPVLWTVTGEGIDAVFATSKGEPFVLGGLPPGQDVALTVTTMDARGQGSQVAFAAQTWPPSPHVILSEVLADPLGPEPEQEWVELYNDGLVDAQLGGYILADNGGETVLPEATLPPGRFALVVNESFVADDEIDVPPAEETILLRVPRLGQSGLGNAGEPLRLVRPDGRTISRFPAIPQPKAGKSVARTAPDAPDGTSTSFTLASPTPGEPNEGF